MATPTNETGAPPDEPIDLDAWYGAAFSHNEPDLRKLVEPVEGSALSVTIGSW